MTEQAELANTLANSDRLLATQLQLARIEGMLTTVLQGHEVRFAALEAEAAVHERRLNDKGKLLARHDEQLDQARSDRADLRREVAELKASNNQRGSKTLGAVAMVISILVGAFALLEAGILPPTH